MLSFYPENQSLESLLRKLEPFESFSKILEEYSTRVSVDRALFDAVIEEFSDATNKFRQRQ